MKPIIEVKNISKKYKIGKMQTYQTLRDTIADKVRHPFDMFQGKKIVTNGLTENEFWALKKVSFSVNEGDVLGIIGRNGAGKSTLLKILSRITPPTEGEIIMRGRVASLLEVGTGFNQELSGRENIYLNGSILGMSQKEINKKFKVIVDFADVEKFIDTPVKFYSSGMYMRLAFSVAAHLESEILLIDEVLAVGDTDFQSKCLGKMDSLSKSGRTIIFVSHNLSAIETLCQNAVIIDKGMASAKASVHHCISSYLSNLTKNIKISLAERTDRTGKGNIKATKLEYLNSIGNGLYEIGKNIILRITLENKYSHDVKVRLALTISTQNQNGLISCDSSQKNQLYLLPSSSIVDAVCTIIKPPLNLGDYQINFAVFYNNEPEDWLNPLADFRIVSGLAQDQLPDTKFNPILVNFNWSMV